MQLAGRRRQNRDTRLGAARHTGVRGIFGGQRLAAAGGLQRRGERVDARVNTRECVVRRQNGLAIGTTERDRTRIAGVRVAIGVLSCDPEALGHSGGGLGGEATDRQMVRLPVVDRNA